MTAPWQEAETFVGDKHYLSPIFTFGGAATIYPQPEDCEGGAVLLKVAADLRDMASVTLTTEETRELASWLVRTADEMDREAAA